MTSILNIFLEAAEQAGFNIPSNHSDCSNSETVTESDNYNHLETQLDDFENTAKANVLKNVLKCFYRYINDIKDPKEQELISSLHSKNMMHSKFKNLLRKTIVSSGKRWNLKISNILQKSSYSKVFQYFLQFKAIEWLDIGKVKNKEEHQKIILFLLATFQNPQFLSSIKYYKKTKAISKSDDS